MGAYFRSNKQLVGVVTDFLKGVAVVDLEATGLDVKRCSIISAGIVLYDGGLKEYYFECKPFRGAVIQPKAISIMGVSKREMHSKNRMTARELTAKVLEVLKHHRIHTIAGQNPHMDAGWLRESARRYGMRWVFGHRYLDMHSVCIATLLRAGGHVPLKPDGRNDLTADNIYKMLGMPEEPRPHNALNGARFEFEALCRLLHSKNALPQFRGLRIKRLA